MEVLSDVKKIVKQIFALENGFGYETTLTNQLYLCFCCLGNSYFTNKLNRRTKIVWFCWMYIAFSLVIGTIISYLFFGRKTGDLLLLIYNGFTLGITSLEYVFKPAILIFLYRKDVEKMITLADKISMKSLLSETKPKINVKAVSLTTMISFWALLTIYVAVASLDLALFYEEEKVRSYYYYMLPLSALEHYGSATFYTIFNSLTAFLGVSLFILCTATLHFVIVSIGLCRNEGERIVNQLNSLSEDYNIDIENYLSFEPQFKRVMETSINDINELTRIISHLKPYLEDIYGISMAVIFFIEIIHALIFVSSDYPLLIKLRELAAFLATIILLYIGCWAGNHLEDLKSDLAFAVYSTPWYWLKSVRKDVYILLCQAQSPINLSAIKVYPLTLTTFLQFLNIVHSTVNLFRAYEY